MTHSGTTSVGGQQTSGRPLRLLVTGLLGVVWLISPAAAARRGALIHDRPDSSCPRVRRRCHLREVCIQPVAYRDHRVALGVVTQDAWTLKGGVSFGRKGGVNTTSFELQDNNFLGAGKSLALKSTASVDRSSQLLSYLDPSFSRLRARLEIGYSDNSDGASAVLSDRSSNASSPTGTCCG